MSFAIGENVGPYRITEKLGRGGRATVFKAYHPALDRYVAIKVLHPAFMEDPNFLARFQREARIVARLIHPNIIPIYDFAEHSGYPYLVMQFVEGETLKARLQHGPVTYEEAMRIMQAVSDALSYAHSQNILHRDIKPSNVIITPEGQIYLTDFGLARMADAGESTLSRDMMVGTPQYISPEQARGEMDLDARTDIYSLGVVMYEMLVGRVPFQADTPYAIVHDHIFTPLPLPSNINPDIPEPLERVLLKSLAKDRESRFETIAGMADAFRAAIDAAPDEPFTDTTILPVSPSPDVAQEEETITEQPEKEPPPASQKKTRPKKKRRWPWVAAAVALLLCLALGMLAIVTNQDQEPPPSDLTAEELLQEARDARESGDTDRALDFYWQVTDIAPEMVEPYHEAGDMLVGAHRLDEAIDFYEQGLDAAPQDPGLHQRLAAIGLVTKDDGLAQEHITWLQSEMPGLPLTHAFAAALILSDGGSCTEAKPELDIALQLDPNLPWAHYVMALCHLSDGDRYAAMEEIDFVLNQDNVPPLLLFYARSTASRLESEGTQMPERLVVDDFESPAEYIIDVDSFGSSIECEVDTGMAHMGSSSLRIAYDIVPDGWGGCGRDLEEVQDWSDQRGISIWIHSDQEGRTIVFELFSGDIESPTPFDVTLTTSAPSVEGWEHFVLAWSDFARADWADENGLQRLDPSQITAFDLSLNDNGPRQGALWVDDITLTEASSSRPSATDDHAVEREFDALFEIINTIDDPDLRAELSDVCAHTRDIWHTQTPEATLQAILDNQILVWEYRHDLGDVMIEIGAHLDQLWLLTAPDQVDVVDVTIELLYRQLDDVQDGDLYANLAALLNRADTAMQNEDAAEAAVAFRDIQDILRENKDALGNMATGRLDAELRMLVAILSE